LLKQLAQHFFHNFVKHSSLVLVCVFLEKAHCSFENIIALKLKIRKQVGLRHQLQFIDFFLNRVDGLLLDFIASKVGNHLSLVRQIELFLVSDGVPRLVNENAQPVDW
jgi:hypothetical protein